MGLHERVKTTYLAVGNALADNRLSEYKWFAEQEVDSWKHWVPFPLHRRLWLWRHGFPSPYGKLYDIETHGPDAFLSELQRYRLYKALNGEHRYLLDDKLSQHWMLSEYPENRPDAYGFIQRGRFHGPAGTTYDGPPVPIGAVLPDLLRRHGRLVLKHLRGEGGKQVVICTYDGEFRLDETPVSEERLVEEAVGLSGYLVTAFVEQHPYAEALYPHSTNTVRLLTIWDEEVEELFTAFAAHRLGTERSRPLDNFSVGGLSAEIDPETGELGPGAQYPFDGDVSLHDTHPDTGDPLAGRRVPEWDAIRSRIEAIALENTNVPAIGWDVVVDRSGTPIVIEANTGTSLDMVQVHRPLLEDPRVARIAARYLPEIEPPSTEAETRPADPPRVHQ